MSFNTGHPQGFFKPENSQVLDGIRKVAEGGLKCTMSAASSEFLSHWIRYIIHVLPGREM